MDAPFLLIDGPVRVAATRKLIKRDEWCALLDAQAILDVARERASEMVADAAHAVQQERERGFREGAEHAQREAAQALAAIGVGAAKTFRQIEPMLVEVVMTALRGLLDEAPARAFYEVALRKVAGVVRERHFLTLRVAPEDEHVARDAVQSMLAEKTLSGMVDIKTDPSLPALSCVMVTEAGTVDASLAVHLAGLRAALDAEVSGLFAASGA
ncbi:type III secretion system stator protein SctL [Burkholderia diffusa]|uniref:type III secretion system stator protein SctL n=1 Tax=Burkholderia diffusa TaxID=488732 RepID=UPI00076D3DBF|nr:type III secretion system stator protein SctL [Burkholderia diffusa]KVN02926.1 hypothetical protein WJ62_11990 [Burkholderia diffusa]